MKTEITNRTIDNKFVVWGYTVDPTYDPAMITEENIQYISQRWIMLDVCDTMNSAVQRQKHFAKNGLTR